MDAEKKLKKRIYNQIETIRKPNHDKNITTSWKNKPIKTMRIIKHNENKSLNAMSTRFEVLRSTFITIETRDFGGLKTNNWNTWAAW